ncbi:MAG: DUF4184 family protein [Candidatus Hodarchaeota archaeon]
MSWKHVPLTPFHYPVGYLLSKTDKRLPLPGLLVGCVIPDIEVPLMWILFPTLQDHLLFHSLIGVLTVGTLVAVAVTRLIYPTVISLFFGVNREHLNAACRVTPTLFVACMIGALSHVLIDVPMHPYNPILWPWFESSEIVGFLVLLFSQGGNLGVGFSIASTLLNSILITLSGLIFVAALRGNIWEELWLGYSIPRAEKSVEVIEEWSS